MRIGASVLVYDDERITALELRMADIRKAGSPRGAYIAKVSRALEFL